MRFDGEISDARIHSCNVLLWHFSVASWSRDSKNVVANDSSEIEPGYDGSFSNFDVSDKSYEPK